MRAKVLGRWLFVAALGAAAVGGGTVAASDYPPDDTTATTVPRGGPTTTVAERPAGDLLPTVEMASSALEAIEGADAAILVTEWPEFGELDWSEVASRMATPLLIDGRNFLDADAVRAAGVVYEGIGRPNGARG